MSAVIRRVRFPAALLTLGVVCALLVARLPPDLERTVVTRRHHGSDPLLSAALLRFGVDSLMRRPARYFTPPILHPDPNPLRGTEPLLAEALLAAPFRLALGDEPAAVYTLTKLATLALVAFFTGLLLRELGVRPALSLLGGGMAVLVGTMPVFVDRLQAVSIQWLALAGLFAARFLRLERRADARCSGSRAAFLTVHSSLYTRVMLVAVAVFAAPRRSPSGPGGCGARAGGRCSAWPRRPALSARPGAVPEGPGGRGGLLIAAFAPLKNWGQAAPATCSSALPSTDGGWPLGPRANWPGQLPRSGRHLLLVSSRHSRSPRRPGA